MKTNKEKLFSVTLKDCEIKTYKGSGAGGQKRNKTSSAIQITHTPSGAQAQCEAHREQLKNKKEAFEKMTKTDKFQNWLKIEALHKIGTLTEIEKKVDKEMANIKIETKNNQGLWEEDDTNNL